MFNKNAIVLTYNGIPKRVSKGHKGICFKEGTLTVVDHEGDEVTFPGLSGGNTWTGDQVGLVANGFTIKLDAEVHVFAGTLGSGSWTKTMPRSSGVLPVVPPFATLAEADAELGPGYFFWDTALLRLRATSP